jgi:hypothetical protein
MLSLIRRPNIWSIFYVSKKLHKKVAFLHLYFANYKVLDTKNSPYRDDEHDKGSDDFSGNSNGLEPLTEQ